MDSDKKSVNFLTVFSIESLFQVLSSILTTICLNGEDPLLGNMLLVCKTTASMRGTVLTEIRKTMGSLLRINDENISKVTDALDDIGWLRLFEIHRSLSVKGVTPVIGNFLAAGVMRKNERYIPSGFHRKYMCSIDSIPRNMGDVDKLEWDRAIQLRIIILAVLLDGNSGKLNTLVSQGIFSIPENREDAIRIITCTQEDRTEAKSHHRDFSVRAKNLIELLKNSFSIDDISDVPEGFKNNFFGTYPPKMKGMQLTFNPGDLRRLNASVQQDSFSDTPSQDLLEIYVKRR
jgi:hypothetical protein